MSCQYDTPTGKVRRDSDSNKECVLKAKDIPCELGVYAIKWQDEDGPLLEIGFSDCGPTDRFAFAKSVGHDHKLVHWEADFHPRSLEAVTHRLLSKYLYDCMASEGRRSRSCSRETFNYNEVKMHYLRAFEIAKRGLRRMEQEMWGDEFQPIHR